MSGPLAFPCVQDVAVSHSDFQGLTKREYVATAILASYGSNYADSVAVKMAIRRADLLLLELSR